MASERFVVRVSKDYLVFCSGHFISYESDKCECLHGHNYRAAVAVEAPCRTRALTIPISLSSLLLLKCFSLDPSMLLVSISYQEQQLAALNCS